VRSRITEKGGNKLADKMFEQTPILSLPAPVAKGLNVSMMTMPYLLSERRLSDADQSSKYLWGSSAWALAKTMSGSKGGMLACNKDSIFTFPDIWYQCSLQTSSFHAAGATIPGVPGVVIGRNENIGWALTSFKADVQDLFVEQFSDDNPDKYKVPGGWGEAFSVNEEIPIRFAGNSLERILITRHGPLLFKDKNRGIALSWTGEQVSKSIFETIWQLDKANNWSQFRAILKNYNGSPQNFLYADEKGNIGAQVAGNIPLRKCDQKLGRYILTAGTRILPGWLDNCLWVDRVAFDDMSSSFNDPDGFVVSSDPRHSMIATNSNNKSSERILGVLYQYKKMAQPLDLSQMSNLQADQLAPLNELIRSELESALLSTNSIDTYKQQALIMLKAWDGQLKADSPAGSLYESFVITFLKRILEPKLGSDLTCQYVERWPRWTSFVAKVIREKPADLLPPGERNYETFLLTTFAQSLKNVRVSLRSEQAKDWQWQKLHPVDFVSFAQEKLPKFMSGLITIFAPAKSQTIGVGGDQDSVNAAGVKIAHAPWDFKCTTGSTERMLIDMADKDKFYQTLSLGQSGHVFSKNRSDQLQAWLNNEHYSIAFSSKQLRLQARHTLILSNEESKKGLVDTN
jgi:penicillin G amidase